MDRVGEQEQIGLTVGRKVGDNLFRRHQNPFVFKPGIPAIFGMLAVAGFNPELGFDGVGNTATGQRLGIEITVRREMIVGTL